MAVNLNAERTIRASLCEIEHGLFYATYPGHLRESDRLELPTYGLGICALDVRQRMEKSLQASGYDIVLWEEGIVLPRSHLPAVAGPVAVPIPLLNRNILAI